jgi:hypothetical protein
MDGVPPIGQVEDALAETVWALHLSLPVAVRVVVKEQLADAGTV